MFDLDQYRTDCAQVTLGQEKIEEMIQVTENQKKARVYRPVRVLIIAAAAIAVLSATAFAASSPAVQEFFASFTHYSFEGPLGMQVDMLSLETPDMALKQVDGRDIFTIDGAEYDVTDAFAQEGRFVLESAQGVTITVSPDGTATVQMPDSPSAFVFDLTEEGVDYTMREWHGEMDGQGNITSVDGEDGYEVEIARQFTYTENADGTVTVTDSEGNVVDTTD